MTDVCGANRATEDAGWLLSSAVLVVTMQGGFALVEGGAVRFTSVANIMMKNLSDMCIGAIAWWAVGWGLAFGQEGGSFMGSGQFFGQDVKDVNLFFFQLSFAATTSTIDSGAVAERFRFFPYLVLSLFMTAWTYPIVAHWVWSSDGFMAQWDVPLVDFAGSGVVHLVGGMSGLVACMWIGPRSGRYDASRHVDARTRMQRQDTGLPPDQEESFQASDPTSQLFGTLLLFIGWFGFNSGSTLGLSNGGDVQAGHVAMTTVVAGAAGGMTGMILSVMLGSSKRIATVADLSNGILSGLVGITAQAHIVTTWEALLVGAIASSVCFGSVRLFDRLKIDDPVSAVSVHGVCGFLALILTGLFAGRQTCGGPTIDNADGLGIFHGGNGKLMWTQVKGALIIAGWSIANTLAFLIIFEKLVLRSPLRVTRQEEAKGLDLVEHGVDQGERLLQYIRTLHLTLSELEPAERASLRRIMRAFVVPEVGDDVDKELLKADPSNPNMVKSLRRDESSMVEMAVRTQGMADELLLTENQLHRDDLDDDARRRLAARKDMLRSSLRNLMDESARLDSQIGLGGGSLLASARQKSSLENLTLPHPDDEKSSRDNSVSERRGRPRQQMLQPHHQSSSRVGQEESMELPGMIGSAAGGSAVKYEVASTE